MAIVAGLYFSLLPLELSFFGLFIIAVIISTILSPISTLIILLIVSPLRTLVTTESPLLLPLDPGQFMFIIFVGSWLRWRFLQKSPAFRRSFPTILWFVVLFATANILSVITASSTGAWLIELLKWVVIIVITLIILDLRPSEQWLLYGLVFAGCANALVGIYIFFGGSGALHLLVNGRFFRAFGTFGQPNPFGGFMGMTAPLAIAMFYTSCIRGYREHSAKNIVLIVFWGITSLLIIIELFMSWSRGAWLGFIISFGIIIILLPRKTWQSLVVLIALFLMSIIIWQSGFIPTTIVDRIESATEELFILNDVRAVDITPLNYPVVERLAHWQAALNMGQMQFWMGVGAGNYEIIYDKYRLLNWREPLGHAHNFYLNVFAETGIIGLFTYILLWLGIIWLTLRVIRVHPNMIKRHVAVGLMGVWAYFLTHSLTDNLFVNNLFIHFGAMIGILALLHNDIRGTLWA